MRSPRLRFPHPDKFPHNTFDPVELRTCTGYVRTWFSLDLPLRISSTFGCCLIASRFPSWHAPGCNLSLAYSNLISIGGKALVSTSLNHVAAVASLHSANRLHGKRGDWQKPGAHVSPQGTEPPPTLTPPTAKPGTCCARPTASPSAELCVGRTLLSA